MHLLNLAALESCPPIRDENREPIRRVRWSHGKLTVDLDLWVFGLLSLCSFFASPTVSLVLTEKCYRQCFSNMMRLSPDSLKRLVTHSQFSKIIFVLCAT